MTSSAARPLAKIEELFQGLLAHDGFGDLQVEVRLLKRGQKEVIVRCGRQYRYVVDTTGNDTPAPDVRSAGD